MVQTARSEFELNGASIQTKHVRASKFQALQFPTKLSDLPRLPIMHLMYTLDEAGNRVYTLKVCALIVFIGESSVN